MRRTALAWTVALAVAVPGVALGAEIIGTGAPDTLSGTAGPDTIVGQAGNDVLRGLGGRDFLAGGEGDDTLLGGPGPDQLDGGPGDNRLSGGAGSDHLTGGPGVDRLNGGRGEDTVLAGTGRDVVRVRDGRQDTVDCGSDGDLVIGDAKDRVSLSCERLRGPSRPPVPPRSKTYDCDDFPLASGVTAQDYLDLYPSDPSVLDHDGDGRACSGNFIEEELLLELSGRGAVGAHP